MLERKEQFATQLEENTTEEKRLTVILQGYMGDSRVPKRVASHK